MLCACVHRVASATLDCRLLVTPESRSCHIHVVILSHLSDWSATGDYTLVMFLSCCCHTQIIWRATAEHNFVLLLSRYRHVIVTLSPRRPGWQSLGPPCPMRLLSARQRLLTQVLSHAYHHVCHNTVVVTRLSHGCHTAVARLSHQGDHASTASSRTADGSVPVVGLGWDTTPRQLIASGEFSEAFPFGWRVVRYGLLPACLHALPCACLCMVPCCYLLLQMSVPCRAVACPAVWYCCISVRVLLLHVRVWCCLSVRVAVLNVRPCDVLHVCPSKIRPLLFGCGSHPHLQLPCLTHTTP